jgi:hypothetical protein
MKALCVAGYMEDPTEDNLINCYLDYANAYGKDLDELKDDIANGEITIRQMCNVLIRSN